MLGRRPTYCSSMAMSTVTFTGFNNNDVSIINLYSKKITYMGGHISSNFDSSQVTHLIASSVLSEHYQEAIDFQIPVVSKDWIEYCWENRNELDFVASIDTIESFEMKPFQGLCMKFVGFTSNELSQFEIIAHENGAYLYNELNQKLTHIICENKEKYMNEINMKFIISQNINIMTINWFWKCIQMDRYLPDEFNMTISRCDDSMQFDYTESVISTSVLYENQPTKTSFSTINESDMENIHNQIQTKIENNVEIHIDSSNLNDMDESNIQPLSMGSISLKKQSTITGESKNILKTTNIQNEIIKPKNVLSDMTLNVTTKNYSPNKSLIKPKIFNENVSDEMLQTKSSLVRLASLSAHSPNIQLDKKIIQEREHMVDELLQTEMNYVKTLKTIIEIFYIPLEKLIKSSNKPIISLKDVKFIFAAFPQILSIHSCFLNELIFTKKSTTFKHICVGTLLLCHIEKYPKAYSPLVNYYDLIYTTIRQWDESNPRFHAFLKSCETDPRCNRETLQQLIIRPIQRLPSTLILLEKIVKYVNPAEPDYKCLIKSIQILKGITLSLNEGKRVLESKMRVFSIINNVEKCPPGIVSFGRDLEFKFEAIEKTHKKMFTKNGRCLVIYLLTDGIEIASKKLLKILSKSVMTSAKNMLINPTSSQPDSTFYIDDVNNVKSDKDKHFKHFLYLDIKNIHSIYNIVPNKSKEGDSSSDVNTSLYQLNLSNNIVGLLYYVDQYHYNFLYFKIQGKNANSDKETFIKKLATKIANYRKLESYNQVIVETSQIVSRRDDLMCYNDDASTSDINFNEETHLNINSNNSFVNVQSPFQSKSNLMKLQELATGSNHSIMSATMMKLKKVKKGGKLSFLGNHSKSKPLERSCSTAGTSKYKKSSVDTPSFCDSQNQSTSECITDDKQNSIENKKKRDSISSIAHSRFSFSLSSWKRNSTCSSSLSKKEGKGLQKDSCINKSKKYKKRENLQNTDEAPQKCIYYYYFIMYFSLY